MPQFESYSPHPTVHSNGQYQILPKKNGVYEADGFTVTPIRNGYRCDYDGKWFSVTMVEDGGAVPEVIKGKTIFRDWQPGVDLILSVYYGQIGLQKIVKTPDAPHSFEMKVEGEPWHMNPDPVAIDNWSGTPVPGRITRADRKRMVECKSQWYDQDQIRYIRHEVKPRTFRVDPRTRVKHLVDGVVYPIRLHATYNYTMVRAAPFASPPNDLERSGNSDPTTWQTSSVRMGYHNLSSTTNHAGMVFPVGSDADPINSGDTINTATITFDLVIDNGSHAHSLYGDDDLTQANFTDSDLPQDVTSTTATGSETSTTVFDVQSIVQELVDDGSWNNKDLMRFIWETTETSGYNNLEWQGCFQYDSGTPPRIAIDYTAAAADVLQAQIMM